MELPEAMAILERPPLETAGTPSTEGHVEGYERGTSGRMPLSPEAFGPETPDVALKLLICSMSMYIEKRSSVSSDRAGISEQ
jgi:hypothetical protein